MGAGGKVGETAVRGIRGARQQKGTDPIVES
jgi:hypothetical protein